VCCGQRNAVEFQQSKSDRGFSQVHRSVIFLAVTLLLLISGCARLPNTGLTTLRPATATELRGYLLANKADVDQFRVRGPFAVATLKNLEIGLSATLTVTMDLYLSAPTEKAPLVIVLHGYGNSKDDHAYQAFHVATWGMHSVALQLPNNGPWIDNGKTLARLVNAIYRQPDLIDPRVDVNKIIVAGHSFGGSASMIAISEGARAVGAILLDPASADNDLPKFLSRINKPVMMLGADEQRAVAQDRDFFFRYVRNGIAEVSIRDAAHEDAQYPAELPRRFFSMGQPDAEELQITFVSALTAAAFSLGATGKFDYAWASFDEAIKNGRIVNAKKK
jgi:pimeloyl-ACP methyl ester carboxylesterase